MALSEFYEATIVRVEADFGFSQFACSPDYISARIGLRPDEVQVKGERKDRGSGIGCVIVPFSSWSISSRGDSKDVNDHLRELLLRLEPARRPFDPAWGEPSFGVTWMGNYLYAGSGPFYEADVIAGIAALGAGLYQDIYQIDQSDDELGWNLPLERIPRDANRG